MADLRGVTTSDDTIRFRIFLDRVAYQGKLALGKCLNKRFDRRQLELDRIFEQLKKARVRPRLETRAEMCCGSVFFCRALP